MPTQGHAVSSQASFPPREAPGDICVYGQQASCQATTAMRQPCSQNCPPAHPGGLRAPARGDPRRLQHSLREPTAVRATCLLSWANLETRRAEKAPGPSPREQSAGSQGCPCRNHRGEELGLSRWPFPGHTDTHLCSGPPGEACVPWARPTQPPLWALSLGSPAVRSGTPWTACPSPAGLCTAYSLLPAHQPVPSYQPAPLAVGHRPLTAHSSCSQQPAPAPRPPASSPLCRPLPREDSPSPNCLAPPPAHLPPASPLPPPYTTPTSAHP